MINNKKPITGVVQTDNKAYSFYLDNYSMIFLDAVVNSNLTSSLSPVDGFAQATTHNGKKMLIYVGNHDFPIFNAMNMGISSYILSTSNIFDYNLSYFDGIEFVGGTLSRLKRPHAFETKYDKKTKRTYIERNDDVQKFSFETEEFSCEVEIGSHTTEKNSVSSRSIKNEDVYFKINFSNRQKTSSLYKHYNKICELLSFLTNRKSVKINEMYLLQNNIVIAERTFDNQRIAQVFIENDSVVTQKQPYHNLEFELLGESVGRLLKILYSPKEKKRSYSLGFYPENDETATIINNKIVREVCSALECETEFVKGIKNDEENRIKALKKKIKPIIDEHKLSDEKLKDKTYSLIESSMKHWSMAAADQIIELFHRYDEIMKLICDKDLMEVVDEDIEEFVKYRNHITHGSYRVLDRKIAYTTHVLACLVYCCVLTRIGVSMENIKNWFHDGRLLR